MIGNNSGKIAGLLMDVLSRNIHGNSNKNPVRAAFAQQAQQSNWTGPIMDDLIKLGMLIYQQLINGTYGSLPQGTTEESLVHVIVNGDFMIADLYYAAWCIQSKVPLGPQEQHEATLANQKFMDIAQGAGFFNQQAPQYGQAQSMLATPGFKLGAGTYGQSPGTGYGQAATATTPVTSASGISSKITMVGVNGSAVTDTSVSQSVPTGETHPTRYPEAPVEPTVVNLTPSVEDRAAWLNYHASDLQEKGIFGPKYTSDRPFDMMAMLDEEGTACVWIPAHLSPYEMDPGPNGPYPLAYSPAHSVRFIVFNPNGHTYESYLHMSDYPDMRYLALEQGASPKDIQKRRLSDLGKVFERIGTPPTNISTTEVTDVVVSKSTPLSEALEEISIMLGTKDQKTVMVSSREEGELQSSVNSPDAKGASCYMECVAYFINAQEAAFVNEIEEAGTLNELSGVFARYENPPVELKRIHSIMNKRLTKHFQPIFEFEFGLNFTDFAGDIRDLLSAILMDNDNTVLTKFIKATRAEVPMALGILGQDRNSLYINGALGIEPGEIPKGTQPLVLSTPRVVVDVPAYSDTFGFSLSEIPSALDDRAIGLSEHSRTTISAIIATHDRAVEDYGDSLIYIRTLDDVRLELRPSLMHPETLTIRKLK